MKRSLLALTLALASAVTPASRAVAEDAPPFVLRNPTLDEMLAEAGRRGVPILIHVLSEH